MVQVDTSFIPDVEREEELRRKKEQLRQEWLEKQEALKNETATIVYSYWDGSGHRCSQCMNTYTHTHTHTHKQAHTHTHVAPGCSQRC